jgi:hypothetical protein
MKNVMAVCGSKRTKALLTAGIMISMVLQAILVLRHFDATSRKLKTIKVYVVPHSHCDPGWKESWREYYESRVKHILRAVVTALIKDERRKFVWADISFLALWCAPPPLRRRADPSLLTCGMPARVCPGWPTRAILHSQTPAGTPTCLPGGSRCFLSCASDASTSCTVAESAARYRSDRGSAPRPSARPTDRRIPALPPALPCFPAKFAHGRTGRVSKSASRH